MQENTNWYWKEQSLQHNIIVPTHRVIHPCLDVVRITDVKEISRTVCNRTQVRKSIQRHPIFITYSDYDYISNEIER